MLAVLVALAVDRILGEPPARLHLSVVGWGTALARTGPGCRPARCKTPQSLITKAFWLGALVWIAQAAMIL